MANLVDILQIHDDCLQIEGVKGVLSVADFFDSALSDSGLSLSSVESADEPWELVYDSISTSGSGNYHCLKLISNHKQVPTVHLQILQRKVINQNQKEQNQKSLQRIELP